MTEIYHLDIDKKSYSVLGLSYAIKLPSVPNFIFERGVGSPKTAENDPSSMGSILSFSQVG